jgi:hypothetical protein
MASPYFQEIISPPGRHLVTPEQIRLWLNNHCCSTHPDKTGCTKKIKEAIALQGIPRPNM